MYKMTYKKNLSLRIVAAQHKCKEISLSLQMIFFIGLLHPCRAQYGYLGNFPEIIAYKHSAYAIIKQLLLHRENLRVQIEMIYKLLKALLIHMDMQFLF